MHYILRGNKSDMQTEIFKNAHCEYIYRSCMRLPYMTTKVSMTFSIISFYRCGRRRRFFRERGVKVLVPSFHFWNISVICVESIIWISKEAIGPGKKSASVCTIVFMNFLGYLCKDSVLCFFRFDAHFSPLYGSHLHRNYDRNLN